MNYKKILKEKKTLIVVIVVALVVAIILLFSSFPTEEKTLAEETEAELIVEEPVEAVPEEIEEESELEAEEEPAEEPVAEVAEEVVEVAEADVSTMPEPSMWYACIKSGTRTERCEGVNDYWKENKWGSDDTCTSARDERAKPCTVYDCTCSLLRE